MTWPNTSLEPTADAALIRMRMDSSIALRVSLPRFTRLWLSSWTLGRSPCTTVRI